MPYYPLPTNTTIGLGGMVTYLNSSLNQMYPTLGGSMFGIMVIVPLWFVVFLPMTKVNPMAAFTTASFISWMAAGLLMALGYLNPMIFLLLLAMWIFGAIAYYMATRN